MTCMSIGEAANVVGVSAKAIRLWEAKGLIPKAERSALGYRTFTDTHLTTMRFIHQAQTLGLTLREIQDIMFLQDSGVSPCDHVRQAIATHISAIDQKVAELLQLRDTLTAAKDAADTTCCSDQPGSVCHIIERSGSRERSFGRGA